MSEKEWTETVREPPQDRGRHQDRGSHFNGGGGKKRAFDWREHSIAFDRLQKMTMAPLTFLIHDLIPEGSLLLGGRPKAGKSWLLYDLAIAAVANRYTLGDCKVTQGDALYISLEDSSRRLKGRAEKLLTGFGGDWPPRLHLITKWPRINEGCVEELDDWARSRKCPRLIIIDTIEKIRPPVQTKVGYSNDYTFCEPLTEFTHRWPGLTLIANYHSTKGVRDDPFDTFQGTTGLTAAFDTLGVLIRKPGSASLHFTGRDIERCEKAMSFSGDTCKWTIVGEASEIHEKTRRAQILQALKEAPDGLKPSAMVERYAHLGPKSSLYELLQRMEKDGSVRSIKWGVYGLPKGR